MESILRSKCEPIPHPYTSMAENVWTRLCLLDGQSVCLIEARTDQRLTVSELKTSANSIAVALIRRGITKTDRIVFSGQNSIQHSILRFTAYLLGNTFMPLSPTFKSYDVKHRLRDVGANIIMSSAQDMHKFTDILISHNENVKLVVVFDGTHDKYVTFPRLLDEGRDQCLTRMPYFTVGAEDIQILSYTSGTTGLPKCAMLSHRAVINETNVVPKGQVVGVTYHFGHIAATRNIPILVLNANTVVLFDGFDACLILTSIEKYKIQTLDTFPFFCQHLLQELDIFNYGLSSLGRVGTGASTISERIANGIIEKYGKLFHTYAMTECAPIASGSFTHDYAYGCVGEITPGLEVKIVDLNGGECLGPGIDGEICVRGIHMFSGYLNNNGAPFDREGWFRTGDIGHYDAEHRLFVTDRLKEMLEISIDSQWYRLSPVEIEHYISTHRFVAEVVVVGVNNRTGSQWPRAYVVLKRGVIVKEREIQKYVSGTLSPFKHLKAGVVFVNCIHRTVTEKVDRKYYRDLVKDEVIE